MPFTDLSFLARSKAGLKEVRPRQKLAIIPCYNKYVNNIFKLTMFEKRKISQVPHGSIVRVDIDDKFLVGTNYSVFKNCDEVHKVYVLDSGEAIELSPDKEVEILRRNGFQLEITMVSCR